MRKKGPNKKYMIATLVIMILALIWTLGSWLVVRNIEEPVYTIVEKRDGYEIRDYAPYMVAEVEVSGSRDQGMNQGFRLLADYIFGNNTAQTGIAMTAPVSETSSAPIAMTGARKGKWQEKSDI